MCICERLPRLLLFVAAQVSTSTHSQVRAMGKQRCALHTAVVAQCFVQAADAMQASHVNNCQPAIAAAETYCQQKMQRTQTKAHRRPNVADDMRTRSFRSHEQNFVDVQNNHVTCTNATHVLAGPFYRCEANATRIIQADFICFGPHRFTHHQPRLQRLSLHR
jgi:hypothetical protein